MISVTITCDFSKEWRCKIFLQYGIQIVLVSRILPARISLYLNSVDKFKAATIRSLSYLQDNDISHFFLQNVALGLSLASFGGYTV